MKKRTFALALVTACGGTTVDYSDVPAFVAEPFWDAIPEGGAAMVTDNYSDTLSVVDLTARELIKPFPVGLNPLERRTCPQSSWNRASMSQRSSRFRVTEWARDRTPPTT